MRPPTMIARLLETCVVTADLCGKKSKYMSFIYHSSGHTRFQTSRDHDPEAFQNHFSILSVAYIDLKWHQSTILFLNNKNGTPSYLAVMYTKSTT